MEAASDLMSRILGEIISSLAPGRTEKEVAWQIEARDSVNAFSSPLVFGVVPRDAIELTPAMPLESGATYTVTLGRFFQGSFSGQERRVIIQMAQGTFRP